MIANENEKPTQFNQLLTVQSQNTYRCPTDSGYADDLGQVFAPTKMSCPFVFAWIEKPNQSACFGVSSIGVCRLETMAAAR
jgi:hypothetical protein